MTRSVFQVPAARMLSSSGRSASRRPAAAEEEVRDPAPLRKKAPWRTKGPRKDMAFIALAYFFCTLGTIVIKGLGLPLHAMT